MKHLRLFAIPLLVLSLSSCSTGDDSNESSSNSNSEREIVVSSLNPMNEPLINNQYYLNHIGDIYHTWKSYQGNGITIAVIDVGFMYDHPDFFFEDGTSKVSDDSCFIKTTGSNTTTAVGKKNLRVSGDSEYNNDHGTFCAGVAAAGINGKGVIGIAPLAKLLLIRTDGHPYSINEAFKYATDKGAKVITISIGSYSDYTGDLYRWKDTGITLSTAFKDAVKYCRDNGTVVISAGGNGGKTEANRPTSYTYPGGTEGVIGVGGLADNKSDSLWTGSSYNASNSKVFCDVFAPSENMYGCCDYNASKYDGGWKGTSFASPIVAGLAALYFEKNPENTVDQFEEDLYQSSHKFTDAVNNLKESNIANGRVDAGKLLGTTLNEKITAKVKNSGDLYAYQWNSVTGKKVSWPGTKIGTGDNKTFEFELDATQYDSVIFNDGGSPAAQTIDLSISSFEFGNTYDIDDNQEFSSGIYIGKYLKN